MPKISHRPQLARPAFKITKARTIILACLLLVGGFIAVPRLYSSSIFGAFDRCGQNEAQVAKNAALDEAQLRDLQLIEGAVPKMSKSKWGDCIDETGYYTQVESSYEVTPVSLVVLHQQIDSRLKTLGYVSKNPLGLEHSDWGSHKVVASADYFNPKHENVNISYIIPGSSTACYTINNDDAEYNHCLATKMNQLQATSVTAMMFESVSNR